MPDTRSTLVRLLQAVILFVVLCFCSVGSSVLAAPLNLKGDTGKLALTSQFQLLEDKSGQLSINDIMRPEVTSRFRPLRGNLSASYSTSAYWLRLDLQRASPSTGQQWLMELTPVMLDDIRLYHPKADGSMETHRAGDRMPFSALEIRHHFPIFLLNLPDTSANVVYLRIQSTSAVFLRATLWTPQTFVEESNFISNMMGVYYGIMLAMIVYNLLLALTHHERSMMYYLLLSLLTLIAGMSLNGHIGMYFAPNWPALVDILPGLVSPLIVLAASLFISSFLKLREKMPRIHWFFVFIQIFCSAAAITVLAGYNHVVAPFVQSLGLLQMLLILPVCLVVGLRGYRPGYIVFMASMTWIAGVLLVGLRNLGLIEPSWMTDYGFQVGSAAEVILLALAQADHISLMKKENANNQAKLLEISQRAEQELDAKVRQRTEELADAVARLQKLDKEKNDFLGIAAHDLKNPLTSIIGMSDLLRKLQHAMPEPQRQHYLERISYSGQRMMRIISNLLEVNAMDTGHLHLNLQNLDLGKVLHDVIQQYEEMLKAKDLILINQIQDSVMVHADLDACVQIIDNLVSNAIKYSPLGRHIWLSVRAGQGMGIFQVRDEGPGLSAEDQLHLFEKFSRLSSLPTAGEHSTGLGLSIVKKLSEACGGSVHCASEAGQGCTFTIELPLSVSQEQDH
ncbi:sensor histidine kinase [Undibacterium sp. CY18W]|uniref:histidine kinase n=1 Tax=Undibacterium hunanense TaxID=2762292 RepID=A0ABR6ZZ06_9BURK|nr:sensor histidine kinase [Undibacterium hunanense]MBC3920805.1 sensor histidine kinase [Undibacterium hunanense]